MYKKGFTLIEFLIVMSIIGILTISGISTFTTSLQRSRDARRKADISTIQKGLELYYTDKNAYPLTGPNNSSTRMCSQGFRTAAQTCDAPIYIQNLPKDPLGSFYYYETDATGSYYKIYSDIERSDDSGTGVNQGGYAGTTCNASLCKYGISSTNTTP